MKTLTRAQLEGSLKADIKPLYLLLGCESYLRGVAAQAIADAALNDSPLREFNEMSFTLLTDDIRSAVAAAEQLPMMSTRRVVKIRDFTKIRVDDEQVLIAYLENPVPSTVMILVADDLDKRKASSKALLDSCVVVDFSPIKDAEAKAWCKTRLKELKASADDQVLSEVIRLVGTDVQTLSTEIDKLAAAAIGSKSISMELVDDLIGRSRELSNFELGDHLMANNRKRALETLHRLLDDGAEPVMLIGLIASNYRKLALGKYVLALGGGRDEVFRNVALPPFKRDSFLATVQRSDATKIAKGLQLLAAADLAIKTSQATPQLQLEMLVCD
ncbi:MAG: DNA polymerase III subunit delta [Acidobacteria bacterium]|nr:MAG: DNA polymerase III subunit delta [Acidobacteriota bacterium]